MIVSFGVFVVEIMEFFVNLIDMVVGMDYVEVLY